MLLRHEDSQEGLSYAEWATLMQKKGFVFPLSQVLDSLEVSRQFVQQHIEPELDYAYYDNGNGPVPGERSFLYFRQTDISAWVQKHAEFSRQTVLVDLADFRGMEYLEEVAKGSDWNYHDAAPPGYVPYDVLDALGVPGNKIEYPAQAKRKEYPACLVPAVDIFSDEGELFHPKKAENTETAYRTAFMEGMVKITLGKRKTIFWRPKQELRVPWLVPYDIALRLEDEYKCSFSLPRLTGVDILQGEKSNWGESHRPGSSQYSILKWGALQQASYQRFIGSHGMGVPQGQLIACKEDEAPKRRLSVPASPYGKERKYLRLKLGSMMELFGSPRYQEMRRELAGRFIDGSMTFQELRDFLGMVKDEFDFMKAEAARQYFGRQEQWETFHQELRDFMGNQKPKKENK